MTNSSAEHLPDAPTENAPTIPTSEPGPTVDEIVEFLIPLLGLEIAAAQLVEDPAAAVWREMADHLRDAATFSGIAELRRLVDAVEAAEGAGRQAAAREMVAHLTALTEPVIGEEER